MDTSRLTVLLCAPEAESFSRKSCKGSVEKLYMEPDARRTYSHWTLIICTIALMHVVIVTSCELARESLMGVRPCQVKVQSACWHCCCQVCPFSVFSKMPHMLRLSLQFDSTNTTKLQDLDVWFFSPFRETQSSGRLVQS